MIKKMVFVSSLWERGRRVHWIITWTVTTVRTETPEQVRNWRGEHYSKLDFQLPARR
jgi:hypothetical protein